MRRINGRAVIIAWNKVSVLGEMDDAVVENETEL